MKVASYITPSGVESFGLFDGVGFIDVGSRLRDRFDDLMAVLQADALSELAAFVDLPADYSPAELVFLPIIRRPGKIFCVGMNYAEKRQEFGETIDAPTLFIRFADSLVGHDCAVQKPASSEEFDYEGELAVVIGRSACAVSKEAALSHVAGYSCFMDGTARDMQYSWFTAGKNWPQTGAFGPWLVTTDELPEPNRLSIHTYLNGQMVQNDNTGNMVRSVAELIEYISAFSPLSPGDVIITGSPGGVGKKRNPPLFLKSGDLIEVELEGIGRLSNRVE